MASPGSKPAPGSKPSPGGGTVKVPWPHPAPSGSKLRPTNTPKTKYRSWGMCHRHHGSPTGVHSAPLWPWCQQRAGPATGGGSPSDHLPTEPAAPLRSVFPR